jgi:hypothetical protein
MEKSFKENWASIRVYFPDQQRKRPIISGLEMEGGRCEEKGENEREQIISRQTNQVNSIAGRQEINRNKSPAKHGILPSAPFQAKNAVYCRQGVAQYLRI